MVKLRLFLLPILLFTISFNSKSAAEEGYEIKIKVKGLKDTTVYLANYYGKNQYYKDTARVNSDGNMIFDGKNDLEEGMYTIVLNNRKVFDFLIVEQKFSIETDTVDYLANMKIKGSEENKIFFEYVAFINQKQIEAEAINAGIEKDNPESEKEGKEKLATLDKEVKLFQKEFVEKNLPSFAAKFIRAMTDIDIPEAPLLENGRKDSTFAYNYYRKHYFDNIDFSDTRLLRTPVFHNRISTFLQKMTLQYPDSLIPAIDFVIGLTGDNYDLFQYCVAWITNNYEKSKIMGMDAIFVHMAETYYLTDRVDWIDSAQTENIREHYLKMKPLLIGKKAPNIILADTSQTVWYNLHQIDAKYTILYIWSPTCGHCKKVTPKMHDLYLKYKDRGLKVYAVSTEYENVEWIKYIKKNNLTWINVSDSPEYPNNIENHPNNYRQNYDVFSTPKIYLLDKDKVIIAKKLEDEQLDDLLERLYKEEAEISTVD